MFLYEFGDTAFVATRPDGAIVGYLLGFVAPTGDGYIHFVAVRDDARGLGLARRLYETFASAARARGATALKAVSSPANAGSIAFHRRLGFDQTLVEDYGGAGRPRVVMRRPLT
jgi:ribosomal protein S18 acetylase RimI-like enzyme